jgi:hypothetical protein
MGFLTRKVTDYTDKFQTNTSSGEKLAWLQQVSQRNLLTQWGETILRIEELFTETVLYYHDNQQNVLQAINRLQKEYMRIDRQLVTVEEAVVLYDVMNTEMPALVYRLGLLKSTRGSSNRNHEDDYLELQKKMEQLLSDVLTVKAKVDAQKLARFSNLSSSQTTQLSNLTWPVFTDLPEPVQKELDILQTLWTAQKDKVHTVEDEYILERIITDYIPSSMSLYFPFISARMEMENTAREALLTQLQLIKNHLENISERNFNEQMRTVKAQTEFLKDRFKTI